MKIEHYKGLVIDRFRERFPEYKIQLNSLEGDVRHLGLSVFGVEKHKFSDVQDLILDIDCEFGVGNGFAVTPLVKSLEVTQKYYPEFLPAQAIAGLEKLEEIESDTITGGLQRSSNIYQLTNEWNRLPSQSFENSFSRAANEELALAA